MSLVGSLEDLALSDILQIVSLSRKSGVLSLSSGEKKGMVIFKAGQVVGASSNSSRDNIGTEIVRKGIITSVQLKSIMAEQKEGKFPGGLNTNLIEKLALDPEKIEEVAKNYIQKVVYGFFDWEEGNFNFELKEQEEIEGMASDSLQYTLVSGLNPQFLAMEGTRLKDEKAWAKRGEEGTSIGEVEQDKSMIATESQPQKPAVGIVEREYESWEEEEEESEVVSAPKSLEPIIVVVDDDPLTLSEIEAFLKDKGYQTETEGKSAKTLELVRKLVREGGRPLVVADLIMPKMDGSGMLGGIEILSRLKSELPEIPVILITDHKNEEAERKAREQGVDAYLDKPKKSRIREDSIASTFAEFEGQLEESIKKILQKYKVSEGKEVLKQQEKILFDIGDELKEEIVGFEGIIKEDEIPPTLIVPSPGLAMLRAMITELSRPDIGGEIMLLILRFASELMNRAVIFLVKKDIICGLGGFGIKLKDEDADKRVRRMRIPTGETSIFKEVIEKGTPITKKLEGNKWDRYIVKQMGGEEPEEVFIAPIFAAGKIAIILYGDNLPEKKEIGDTISLEIFLAQSGLAMDRALLERKLKDLTELQKTRVV
ncbi:MAG: response regulator [Deltaproteobacteria bacterium]|nr:MAG: response regulator [Deltaproteobacteria bacterium]